MTISTEQHGIRKSLLVTTSVTIVYALSDTADVNWIVSVSGLKAWWFILVVHGYFSLMWFFHRAVFVHLADTGGTGRRLFMHKGKAQKKRDNIDKYFGSKLDGDQARQFMARRFTDAVALIGLGVAGWNVAVHQYAYIVTPQPVVFRGFLC